MESCPIFNTCQHKITVSHYFITELRQNSALKAFDLITQSDILLYKMS